jgi:hypothetical protein
VSMVFARAFGFLVALVFLSGVVSAAPLFSFVSQEPVDVNDSNIVSGVTIIFDVQGNVEEPYLEYAIDSLGPCHTSIAGVCVTPYPLSSSIDPFTSVGTQYYFTLGEFELLPAMYNVNETTMIESVKSVVSLSGANRLFKIRFEGFDPSASTMKYEVDLNSSTQMSATVYFCNENYGSGRITDSPFCTIIGSIGDVPGFDHTHVSGGGISYHDVLPIPISGGLIGGIPVTSVGYIVLRVDSQLVLAGIPVNTGSLQTSTNNGQSWSNSAFTADSHIHQFRDDLVLEYRACADSVCSVTVTDGVDGSPIIPEPPILVVDTPMNGDSFVVGSSINVSWSAFSNFGAGLSYVVLFAGEEVYDGSDTSVLIDTTGFDSGSYELVVVALDDSVYSFSSSSRA